MYFQMLDKFILWLFSGMRNISIDFDSYETICFMKQFAAFGQLSSAIQQQLYLNYSFKFESVNKIMPMKLRSISH